MIKSLPQLTSFALITGALLGMSACTSGHKVSEDESALQALSAHDGEAKSAYTGYQKPSAAINFSHDFDGRGELGVTETINLRVDDAYPGGTMAFDVVTDNNLQVFENALLSETVSLDGETPRDYKIVFQPISEGIHNISIVAKVQTAQGQSMRQSFGITVYVGEAYKPVKQSSHTGQNTQDLTVSDGLVIMEAEETIED